MNEYIVAITQNIRFLIKAENKEQAEQLALESDIQNGDIEILDVAIIKEK